MVYNAYARHMQLTIVTLVVVAANVLGAAMAAPQVHKLVRTRQVAGVSITWATSSATVNTWWGVYGIGTHDLGIVPVSVVSVLCYLTITLFVVRHGPVRGRALALPAAPVAATLALLPAAALWLDGWAAAGVTLGLLYGIQLLPAVVGVYRAVDVSGVSVATWLLAVAEAILWGVYGWWNLDAGLLALAATGTTMSLLVLARLFLRRPRRGHVGVVLGSPGFATA